MIFKMFECFLLYFQIEEMMTPSEKLQLDKVHGQIQKLGMGETVVEQTLFILQMYLRYH